MNLTIKQRIFEAMKKRAGSLAEFLPKEIRCIYLQSLANDLQDLEALTIGLDELKGLGDVEFRAFYNERIRKAEKYIDNKIKVVKDEIE